MSCFRSSRINDFIYLVLRYSLFWCKCDLIKLPLSIFSSPKISTDFCVSHVTFFCSELFVFYLSFFLLYHAVQLKLENSWMICWHQTFIFFLDGPFFSWWFLSSLQITFFSNFFQGSATSLWLIWLSLEKGWFKKENEKYRINKCTHNMLKRATLFSHLFPTKKHIPPLPTHWAE